MDTYAQMIEVCEDAANVVSMRAEEIGKGSGAGLERVKDFLDRAFEAKQKRFDRVLSLARGTSGGRV